MKSNKKQTKTAIIRIALVALIIFILFLTGQQIKQNSQLYSEVSRLEKKLQAIEEDNLLLEEKIQTLDSPDVIEREARERLNLKKEGENVVIIIPSEREPVPEIVDTENDIEQTSFWQKLKNWLGI